MKLDYIAQQEREQVGTKFKNKCINPIIEEALLEMTIPGKPDSSLQKYRLTPKGDKMLFPH